MKSAAVKLKGGFTLILWVLNKFISGEVISNVGDGL